MNKKSLRRNIVFLPFQSNVKELYGLMKASSVYVLPSTREGFGLVVLEANACGLPVVTVRHASNAAQALIRPENGVVCELKKEELAKAIKGYVNSPTPMKIDKELKKLDWDVVVSKIEAAFLTQIG